MNDLAWKINGLALPTGFGQRFVTQTSSWRADTVETIRRAFSVPGVHGTQEYGDPVFGETQVKISARFRYPTQAALEAAVNSWNALVTTPRPVLSRVSGGITTTATARLVSHSQDEYLSGPPEYTARTTTVFAIPGVFFREAAEVSADLAFNADLALAEVASLSGSSAPVVDAVARVTGPCSEVYITDPQTGSGLYWKANAPLVPVAAGQYLFLDSTTMKARVSANANDWATGGTDVTAGVKLPAAGALQIWPVLGATLDSRTARINATGAGRSAATKLAFRAGRSHL